MDNMTWGELHCEHGDEKELYAETRTTFSEFIDDHVDYEVMIHIRVFTDGTRICEVEDEWLNHYDDEGTMRHQFRLDLPPQYINKFLQKAEDYDVY